MGHFQTISYIWRVEVAILLSKLLDEKREICAAAASSGGGLEWLIEPDEQVALDEQLLAQQSGEIGQTPAEAGAQLQVFQQQQGDQSGPDLNLQGVGGWCRRRS